MASGETVCVVGAGGFIASWLVANLLKKGYHVRGTVRNPDDDSKYGHLKVLEGASERLKLFEADLLDYESLVTAIRGCDGVFHTACPVKLQFKNPDVRRCSSLLMVAMVTWQEVLVPAIKGTENVLRACLEEKVKRVVMTSSAAAMIGISRVSDNAVLDEDCWSDVQYCKENKRWYYLAKTESEKLAWGFSQKHNLDLVTVLPVFVIGPLLQSTSNTSSEILKRMIDGSMERYPNSYIGVVDVRDTAEVHVLAYEKPDCSGRYFCTAKTVYWKEIAEIVKKHFPQLPCSDKCDAWEQEGYRPHQVSNAKVLSLIGDFIPFEKTIVDGVNSLKEKGLLP